MKASQLKLTTAWIAKQARNNPESTEWQQAIEMVRVMNHFRAGSAYYWEYQMRAVTATVRALLLDDELKCYEDEIMCEYKELYHTDDFSSRMNYKKQFRFDVLQSYLIESGAKARLGIVTAMNMGIYRY